MVTFIGLEKQIFGYGKSSIQEDTVHVLQAIVEDLEDELQWPDAEKRQELGAVFPGMFNGCIGVSDVKEYQVVKYLDTVKERRSWSSDKVLFLAIHAAIRLHNLIMNSEQLSYSALESVDNLYTNYY